MYRVWVRWWRPPPPRFLPGAGVTSPAAGRSALWRDGFEVVPMSTVPTRVFQWTPSVASDHARHPGRPWAYPRTGRIRQLSKIACGRTSR